MNGAVSSPVVDRWSAACQVFKRLADFETMLHLAQAQRDKRGWRKFGYKLFDVRTSPRLEALVLAV